MVLNEAPGEKIRPTWYSRLAQERRELSASVEEALINTSLNENFWLDDISQSATAIATEQRNNVFPPRLSMQSRSLPGTLGTSSNEGKGLVSRHRDTERHPSIWKRFAHRLTSSFVAFCFHPVATTTTNITAIPTTDLPPEDISMCSVPTADVASLSSETNDANERRVLSINSREVSSKNEYCTTTGTAIRHGSPPHMSYGTQGRQRLAGRTTRIRLEVVPGLSSSDLLDKEKKSLEAQKMPDIVAKDCVAHKNALPDTRTPAFQAHNDITHGSMNLLDNDTFCNEGGTSVRLSAIEKPAARLVDDRAFSDGDGGTTSIRLPAIEKVARIAKRSVDDRAFRDGDGGTTSIRLPAVEQAAKRQENLAPGWHAGTGMFECGQRDVTISAPSVTASSVVLVMLTANPGPVVVQYVSLQPRIGFTVHLTAPTTMGAPFNYVMLGGETH